MQIITRTSKGIPKKYLRRLKYKLNKLNQKFKHLVATNLYIQFEGVRHKTYTLKLVFTVPGPDVVVTLKGHSLSELIDRCLKISHRQLAKVTV